MNKELELELQRFSNLIADNKIMKILGDTVTCGYNLKERTYIYIGLMEIKKLSKRKWSHEGTIYDSESGYSKRVFLTPEFEGTLDAIMTSIDIDTQTKEDIVEVDVRGQITLSDGVVYEPKTYKLYLSEDQGRAMHTLNNLIDTLQEFKEALFDAYNKKDELETKTNESN
jgi:hypothetical protein